MRLFIVANTGKAQVRPALEKLIERVSSRAHLVGVDTDRDADLSQVEADAILVLGGDGTLLSAIQRLKGRQIPLMGVNFGRLGFLASFTPDRLLQHVQELLDGKLQVSRRMMLDVALVPAGADETRADSAIFRATALNDAVITAGPPFHMIQLEIEVDGHDGIRFFGDGVIISTPSGSTAYNLSAGGPIISPGVDAMCITPICPHSVSFRPAVIASRSRVRLRAARVNEGTTLFCDGQASTKVRRGDRILICSSPNDALLIENPHAEQWSSLADKMHWAVSPRYSEEKRDGR